MSYSLHATTITGKTADFAVVQMKVVDTLHKAPQKVAAKKAGCSQNAVSKHINGKLTGIEKRRRKKVHNQQG